MSPADLSIDRALCWRKRRCRMRSLFAVAGRPALGVPEQRHAVLLGHLAVVPAEQRDLELDALALGGLLVCGVDRGAWDRVARAGAGWCCGRLAGWEWGRRGDHGYLAELAAVAVPLW